MIGIVDTPPLSLVSSAQNRKRRDNRLGLTDFKRCPNLHEKTPAVDNATTGVLKSGGDRIRTCDLEVMSLASYRAAPPRVVDV